MDTYKVGSWASEGTLRMAGKTNKKDVGALHNIEMIGWDLDAVTTHDVQASMALVQYDITLSTVMADHTSLQRSISQLRTLWGEDLPDCECLQAAQAPWIHLAIPLPHCTLES